MNGPPPSGLTTANAAPPVQNPTPPTLPPPARDPTALIAEIPQLAPFKTALLRLYDDIAKDAGSSNILATRRALLGSNERFTRLLAYPDPLILGLFLKLFSLQDKYLILKETWPPETYPSTGPSLLEIVGIRNETTPQAVVRLLRNLRPTASPAENFQEIKRLMTETDDPAEVIGRLTGTAPDSAEMILTLLSQSDQLDRDLILFNPATQPARYIPVFFKEPATYDEFLYRLEWYNNFVETPENLSFEQKIFVFATNRVLFKQAATPDQQMMIILPKGETIGRIIDKYNAVAANIREQLTTSDIPVWISSTLSPSSIAKNDFFVIQGYRRRKFPCPQLLVSLAQETPQMSPAAAAIFPEWRSRTQITAWLAGVLQEWYADIRIMRATTVDDRDRRDVQLRLFYYVIKQIQSSPSAEATSGAIAMAAAEEAVVQPQVASTNRRGRLSANVAALAAAANVADPNQLFERVTALKGQYSDILAENLKQRPAVRALIDPLPPRRRGWFTGQSKDAYRRTVKARIDLFRQMYGAPTLPSANTSRADALTMVLNEGRDARAAWIAFKAWREAEPRLFDGTTDPALAAEIAAVGPKGFFAGTTAYVRRLQNLLRRFQGLAPVGGGGRRTAKRKTAAFSRKMRRGRGRGRRQTHRGSRRQRGGATPMPLAYYQPGAQMLGTSAEPTGTGLAATNSTWARAPLPRGGGRRRTQRGGWGVPSVMGAFVANGSRLLPVAAYMGYRQAKRGQ